MKKLALCLCLLLVGCVATANGTITQLTTFSTVTYEGADGAVYTARSNDCTFTKTTVPDLEIVQTPNQGPVATGTRITFTAKITNKGTEMAKNLVFKPDQVHFTMPATVPVGSIAPGASVSISWEGVAK